MRTHKQWCEIYVISEGTEWFKIGISANTEKRIEKMQTGNPRRLSLVASFMVRTIRIDAVEKRAHEALAFCERRGEWFKTDRETAILAIAKAARDKYRIGLDRP
jgi:hypothetical protein